MNWPSATVPAPTLSMLPAIVSGPKVLPPSVLLKVTAPFTPMLQQSYATTDTFAPPVDRTSGEPKKSSPESAFSDKVASHLRAPGSTMQTFMAAPLLEIDASTASPFDSTTPDPLSPVPPTANLASSGCGSPTVPPAGLAMAGPAAKVAKVMVVAAARKAAVVRRR